MRLLERYVLWEHVLPFLLGFGVVTSVILLQFIFNFLDLLVGKGIPAPIVGKLLLLALGWITALSVPCGVLVGSLMTFGRLSQDNEITALRASGVHMGRVLGPAVAGGIFMALVLTLFNNFVLPETNHAFATLSMAIHRKSPTARIVPGVFVDDFPDKRILVGEIDNRTGEMKDVTIYDFAATEIPTTILAREGRLTYLEDGSTLRFDLRNGEIHEVPPDGEIRKYRRVQFANHTLMLHNTGSVLEEIKRESRGEREMNVAKLQQEIERLEENHDEREQRLQADLDSLGFESYATFARRVLPPPTGLAAVVEKIRGVLRGPGKALRRSTIPDNDRERVYLAHLDLRNLRRRINSYTVEVHKKFSIPFACVVFVLLGAPLGIRARRSGMAAGAIGLVFILVYYLFLIGGEQLAERMIITPATSMWAPNVILGIPGVWMTWKMVKGRD